MTINVNNRRGDAPTGVTMVSKEDVMKVLEGVIDPEIGLSVVDLGLIYEVNIDGGRVGIKMTLTTPGCPLAAFIAADAKRQVGAMEGVDEVDVDVVFEPPWSPDMMSEKAKKMLGYSG